jgi:hypothetical protein
MNARIDCTSLSISQLARGVGEQHARGIKIAHQRAAN